MDNSNLTKFSNVSVDGTINIKGGTNRPTQQIHNHGGSSTNEESTSTVEEGTVHDGCIEVCT